MLGTTRKMKLGQGALAAPASSSPRSSLRWATVLSVSLAGACGSDPAPVDPVPTPADMRTFWGLNPGSCWVYKDLTMQSAGITVSVDGPDSARIAGRNVYVLTQSKSAGGRANELLLDTDTPGKMFLARSIDGSANPPLTETYLEDPRPLWGELDFAADGTTLEFAPEGPLESAATPRDGTAPIAHKWTVISKTKEAAIPSGPATALQLNYTKAGMLKATYDLVPGFGMAHIQLDGVDYQVCLARVCDAAGVCTGADSCAAATCGI